MPFRFTRTAIPDVVIIEPPVFSDERGFFMETYKRSEFAAYGIAETFVQCNHSKSERGILRGLHYQIQHPQGKLVRVTQGAVLDVAADIRKSSRTFGKHVALELSAENKRMLWIPEGFAHGFVVLSDSAEFLYKTTDYWFPEHERCIRWDDPTLAIDWGLQTSPAISAKDEQGKLMSEAELFS